MGLWGEGGQNSGGIQNLVDLPCFLYVLHGGIYLLAVFFYVLERQFQKKRLFSQEKALLFSCQNCIKKRKEKNSAYG